MSYYLVFFFSVGSELFYRFLCFSSSGVVEKLSLGEVGWIFFWKFSVAPLCISFFLSEFREVGF